MESDLEAVAQGLGARREMTDFLRARGIPSLTSLATIAKTSAEIDMITSQFLGDTSINDSLHRCNKDEEATTAVMRTSWEKARARCPETHTATDPAPLSFAENRDTSTVPIRIPSRLWDQQIRRYNNITIAGRDRTFPEAMLAGADKVLARVHHEHTVSKQYTPVGLGEIRSEIKERPR